MDRALSSPSFWMLEASTTIASVSRTGSRRTRPWAIQDESGVKATTSPEQAKPSRHGNEQRPEAGAPKGREDERSHEHRRSPRPPIGDGGLEPEGIREQAGHRPHGEADRDGPRAIRHGRFTG